jgi:hypothetical protein
LVALGTLLGVLSQLSGLLPEAAYYALFLFAVLLLIASFARWMIMTAEGRRHLRRLLR